MARAAAGDDQGARRTGKNAARLFPDNRPVGGDFTPRKIGHGSGPHSGALAAEEFNGSLKPFSFLRLHGDHELAWKDRRAAGPAYSLLNCPVATNFSGPTILATASWAAAVPCRFPIGPAAANSNPVVSTGWLYDSKAPEDCRSPKPRGPL